MNQPYKISKIKSTVIVSGITLGETSSIRVEYLTRGTNGLKRSFFRQIPVPDPSLFMRVQAELHTGDEIEITAINEWYEDGYATRLAGFTKTADLNGKDGAANGSAGSVHNTTDKIAPPPAREARLTAKR